MTTRPFITGQPIYTVLVPFPHDANLSIKENYRRGVADQEQGLPATDKSWALAHGYTADANAYFAGYEDSAHGQVKRRPLTPREQRDRDSISTWTEIS